MKKLLLLLVFTSFVTVAKAVDFSDERSSALLAEITIDINDTLSTISGLESGDWSVSLARSDNKLIRIGVVLEPSTKTILSVTADGVGSALGLKPGDRLKKVYLNGKLFTGNFSAIGLTHGDQLELNIFRNGKDLQLNKSVSSSFIPKWELYSRAKGITAKETGLAQSIETQLQSERGIALLKKLQARINLRLSEIYRLESKASESELQFTISQKKLVETRLGMVMDQNTNTVIRLEQGSNAEKAGVEVGDVLTSMSVNKTVVENLSELNLSGGDNVSIDISRDGIKKTIVFESQSNQVPAWSLSVDSETKYSDNSCGVITVFFDPPFTKDIYKAFLTEVDGDLLPKTKREDSITLSAGKHRVLIHERIPSRLKRRNSRGKLVEFMVEPNKRYFLGVKYDRSKRFSSQGKYWQPYVWKVEDYECSE